MSLTLRYMRLRDIKTVAAIDAVCFQPSWTRDSFAFELCESTVSHMVVLERRDAGSRAGGVIVGYGGLWQIEDEAHISTLATHPSCRGLGYGEVLLAALLGKALRLRAAYVVLEVRVGNEAAQRLYRKFGFRRVGRKRNYYQPGGEDAWDMRLSLDGLNRRRCEGRYAELLLRHGFRDVFVGAPRGKT